REQLIFGSDTRILGPQFITRLPEKQILVALRAPSGEDFIWRLADLERVTPVVKSDVWQAGNSRRAVVAARLPHQTHLRASREAGKLLHGSIVCAEFQGQYFVGA